MVMLMNRQFRNAYQNSLAVEVEAASPHKLILMLFDGAMQAIRLAKIQIEKNDISEKGRLISKAIAIVDEGLRASLHLEEGGELAANLDALYDYCSDRLLQANLNNSIDMLQEVESLLGEVRGAWAEIKPQQGVSVPSSVAQNYGAI